MTSEEKKKFLAIKTYEEFNQRRCSTELATVEERDKLANEEMRQVYLWWDEEENKVIETLKKIGCYETGLDAYSFHPEIVKVRNEAKKKLKEIYDKYYTD